MGDYEISLPLYGLFGHAPAQGLLPRKLLNFSILEHPSNFFIIITIFSFWCRGYFKRNRTFSLCEIWPRLSRRTTAPGVMKFKFVVHRSLDFYYYILSLSKLYLGAEKENLKEIMHFRYMTYLATPQYKNPCPGVKKFKHLVDPSLVIIILHLICPHNVLEKRSFFISLPYRFYIPNLLKFLGRRC